LQFRTYDELSINQIPSIACQARFRAYKKWRESRTYIKNIIEPKVTTTKHSWSKTTQIWLKQMKIDMNSENNIAKFYNENEKKKDKSKISIICKTHAYTLPNVNESAQTTVSRFIDEMTEKLQEKAVIRTQKVENRQYKLPKKIKNLIEIKRITDEKMRKGLTEVNDYHVAHRNVKEAI
jgi:hypothetical protein